MVRTASTARRSLSPFYTRAAVAPAGPAAAGSSGPGLGAAGKERRQTFDEISD